MVHKFEMKSHENPLFSDVFIDGEKVSSGITGVEFEQFAGELPVAILHMRGSLDLNTFANVLYVADEESVCAATKYLKESIEKDEALHDEFKSRILLAIDDLSGSFDGDEFADKILDLIFGEDTR